jgi:hypothetical protein
MPVRILDMYAESDSDWSDAPNMDIVPGKGKKRRDSSDEEWDGVDKDFFRVKNLADSRFDYFPNTKAYNKAGLTLDEAYEDLADDNAFVADNNPRKFNMNIQEDDAISLDSDSDFEPLYNGMGKFKKGVQFISGHEDLDDYLGGRNPEKEALEDIDVGGAHPADDFYDEDEHYSDDFESENDEVPEMIERGGAEASRSAVREGLSRGRTGRGRNYESREAESVGTQHTRGNTTITPASSVRSPEANSDANTSARHARTLSRIENALSSARTDSERESVGRSVSSQFQELSAEAKQDLANLMEHAPQRIHAQIRRLELERRQLDTTIRPGHYKDMRALGSAVARLYKLEDRIMKLEMKWLDQAFAEAGEAPSAKGSARTSARASSRSSVSERKEGEEGDDEGEEGVPAPAPATRARPPSAQSIQLVARGTAGHQSVKYLGQPITAKSDIATIEGAITRAKLLPEGDERNKILAKLQSAKTKAETKAGVRVAKAPRGKSVAKAKSGGGGGGAVGGRGGDDY